MSGLWRLPTQAKGWRVSRQISIHRADVPGAAISSPWNFPPKVLVTFFRLLGKWERRAEAFSDDNIGGVNNAFKEQLS